jgi:acetylornithine deacetylase
MENRIIEILTKLVEIDSSNPDLSNGPGEKEIAEFIGHHLQKLKIDTELQSIDSNRTNTVAIIPGSARNQSLLLNGHLDTVGVEGMENPFSMIRDGDRLYGRGCYDMKGSLAVMLLLAEYFTQYPPPFDILFTFVADEENKSIGMEHMVKKWLPDVSPWPFGAIFLEPTEQDIGVCHKGFTWYEVEVIGKAAHGSRPGEGIDAILPLRAALDELDNIQSQLQNSEPDPLLGHATLHSSIIQGGTELSVIPPASRLQWERRTLPRETQQDLNLELNRVIQAVKCHPGDHEVKGREIFIRRPYRAPDEAEVLMRLQKHSPESKLIGLYFWADSGLVDMVGIPAVLFGPVGQGAHAVDEWVSLKSLIHVYEVLKKVILA